MPIYKSFSNKYTESDIEKLSKSKSVPIIIPYLTIIGTPIYNSIPPNKKAIGAKFDGRAIYIYTEKIKS